MASNTVIAVIIITIFFLLIAGAVILMVFLRYFKKSLGSPVPPDSPLVTTLFPTESGHTDFFLIERKENEGQDRVLLTLRPRDLAYVDGDPQIAEDIELAVRKHNIFTLPKGSLSAFRNRYIIIPQTIDGLNENFRQTSFGRMIVEIITKRSSQDYIIGMFLQQQEQERTELTMLGEENSKISKAKDRLISNLLKKDKDSSPSLPSQGENKK
jgi:hypothetical protein